MRISKIIQIAIISIIIVGVSVLLSLSLGSRYIKMDEVIDILIKGEGDSFLSLIISQRIPRTVFGLIAGAALGVSGALMQSITRNPIADPSILGVNTGASLFVVIGIAFLGINTANQYIWLALFGAAASAVFVYGMASAGRGGANPIKLALAGATTSAALSSLVSTIMLPNTNVMNDFRFWQVGSIGGASWEGIRTVTPFLIIGFLLAMGLTRSLNAMALGDEVATGLGVNTRWTRAIAAFAGVLLCGATTALTGPIGFVGLMVPHLVRLLCGADMRVLIPISAIGGASLLVISDVIGRVLGSPGELEVGIVTAFLGAPVFIMVARRAKVRTL